MAPVATEDDFADTVPEIVAHLKDDPVLVDETMGNGHTELIREVLSQKASDSPVPVHVVLSATPSEVSNSTEPNPELVSVLHGRTGVDGVWLVATPSGRLEVGLYADLVPGDEYDDTRLSSATREAMDDIQAEIATKCDHCSADTPALEAAVTIDILTGGLTEEWDSHPLTQAQIESYATSTWWSTESTGEYVEDAEMPTAGAYAMSATVGALCVGVVGYRLLQAVGGTRHAPLRGKARPTPPTAAELDAQVEGARRAASEAHTSLSHALVHHGGEGADPDDWERRDIATACLERAESRLDSDDLLELVGALVLARTGSHALERRPHQYRCCYVDPRHGEASTSRKLGGGLKVPVCRRCADALKRDRPLKPLQVKGRFGRAKPYYTGNSVWSRSGYGSLGGPWWQDVPR